jgi:hypothetical protein
VQDGRIVLNELVATRIMADAEKLTLDAEADVATEASNVSVNREAAR